MAQLIRGITALSAKVLLALGDNGFHPPLEDSPFQENAPVTPLTLDPDISPQSYHLPVVAAARVLLPQVYYISKLRLHGFTARLLNAD